MDYLLILDQLDPEQIARLFDALPSNIRGIIANIVLCIVGLRTLIRIAGNVAASIDASDGKRDWEWPQKLAARMAALDELAGKAVISALYKRIEVMSKIDPSRDAIKPPSVPPLLVLGLVFASLSTACGASTMTHARIAEASAPWIHAVHDAVMAEVNADIQDIASSDVTDTEKAAAAVAALKSHAPILSAVSILTGAFYAYRDEAVAANANGTQVSLSAIATLRAAWAEVIRQSRIWYIDLPEPPTGGVL